MPADPPVLDDGTYDVFVVDATAADDDPATCVVELTIVAGDHKGEVVSLRAAGLARDADAALELLGTPGTLVVTDGVPTVTLER